VDEGVKMEYAKALKEAKPFDSSWPRYGCALINRSCILPCKMCLNWKSQAENPGNKFTYFKKYIESLAEFVEYPMEINIMGGEPLLEDWIFDLIEVVENNNFTSIISTNAYLIDDKKAKQIMDSSLRVVGISLDSIYSEVHNFYRGKQDVAQRVFEAIRLLEKHKLPNKTPVVDILTLFMKKNLDGIIDLVKWVDNNSLISNVAFSALLNSILPQGTENWFRRDEYRDIWPDDTKKVCEVIDELIYMKKNGSNIVNPVSQLQAFKEYYKDPIEFIYSTPYSIRDFVIEMESTGELYLSGHRLGNINDCKTLKEKWYSLEADKIREKVAKYGSESSRSALINFICVFQEDNCNGSDCPANNKDFIDYQSRQGFYYQKKGKYKQAIEHFKKALEKNPSNPDLHIGVAYNCLKLGDYKVAVEEYDKLFQLNPKFKQEFIHDYNNAVKGLLEITAQQDRISSKRD